MSDFRGKPQFFSMKKLRKLLTWARKNNKVIIFNFSGRELGYMRSPDQEFVVNALAKE